MKTSDSVVENKLDTFSVTFLVAIESAIEVVRTETAVLVEVTTGCEPVGWIVEVTVMVRGRSSTENGEIPRAVKSIHVMLEKKLVSSKAVASSSVIWCENLALEVLIDPGPVFWYSPKKTPSVFGVLVDHSDHPAGLIQLSRNVLM